MSYTTISNLPPCVSLSGSEQIEIVQSGASARATTAQLKSFIVSELLAQVSALTARVADLALAQAASAFSGVPRLPSADFFMICALAS